MPHFEPYLTFDGSCAEAMRFYERILGGRLEVLTTHVQGRHERILHARLVVDGRALMAADSMAGQPCHRMHGFALALQYGDVDEARRVFDALAAGGQVKMPLTKVFWADLFGMVVDRFGTPWMVHALTAG